SVKEVVRVLVHLCNYGSHVSRAGLLKIVVCSLHDVILELVIFSTCFPLKRLAIGGKALVEPDVLPVPTRHQITEPLMSKLMRYEVVGSKVQMCFFVVQRVKCQRSATGIFHAAVDEILHRDL